MDIQWLRLVAASMPLEEIPLVNPSGGRNPSINWSSTEGSVETMSIAISEMTEGLHNLEFNQHQVMQTMPSPDHLVNRRDLLERMGINPGPAPTNHKSRSQSASRCHNGEFAPHWSMNDQSNARKQDDIISVMTTNTDDFIQATTITYDIPKAQPVLPAKKNSTPSQHSTNNKIERRMVSATPCPCDGSNMLTQSYENYDIPKTITQVRFAILLQRSSVLSKPIFQEAIQFYDTPRNLFLETTQMQAPPVGPYANYDMPQLPIPVYRKPCGCIMKLIKVESK